MRAKRLRAKRARARRARRLRAKRLRAKRLRAKRLRAKRLRAKRLRAKRLRAKRLRAKRLRAKRLRAKRLRNRRLRARRARRARRLRAKRLRAKRLRAKRARARRARALRAKKLRAKKLRMARLRARRLRIRRARARRARALRAARLRASRKPFPIKMTVDNTFRVYVNGKKVGSGNSWTRTYSFRPRFNKVTTIAVEGRDRGGPAALIGVFNGRPTKASEWKCKNFGRRLPRNWMSPTFDDSKWPRARSYGRNNQNTIWRRVGRGRRPGIPNRAEWIWTRNNRNHNRVICRTTLVSKRSLRKITVRKGYANIERYLTGISRDLRTDAKLSGNLDKRTRRRLNRYNSKIIRIERSVRRTRKRLRVARRYNSAYVREFNHMRGKKRSLLASLKRQRKFIAVEHAYINKMEREALSLKKTSPHYKAIRTEVLQMRVQMKKEIRDIERAYARAMAHLSKRRNKLSRRRTRSANRIRQLSRLISRHNTQMRQLQKLVSSIHRTQGVNTFTIKAINHLSRATSEFNAHVRDMAKKAIMLNFRSGYSQCKSETYRIKRFYKKATCKPIQ